MSDLVLYIGLEMLYKYSVVPKTSYLRHREEVTTGISSAKETLCGFDALPIHS